MEEHIADTIQDAGNALRFFDRYRAANAIALAARLLRAVQVTTLDELEEYVEELERESDEAVDAQREQHDVAAVDFPRDELRALRAAVMGDSFDSTSMSAALARIDEVLSPAKTTTPAEDGERG